MREDLHVCDGLGRWNLYGLELQKPMRRQANNLEQTPWGLEIRVTYNNRIATGMALVRRGSEEVGSGDKDPIFLNGCFPLGSGSYARFRRSGAKIEERVRHPMDLHMFAKTAKQQSMLYAAAYGEERLLDRLSVIGRPSEIRDGRPEFFTRGFLIGTWG